MSSIHKAFEKGKAFISFLTAGDPTIDKTEEFILAMAQAGSDLIEIGIPFSDPVAEGKVIERANERALKAGATTDKIFNMVARIREKIKVPLVFLTYINPIFVYGTNRFFQKCKDCGIDGVIIPDLPFEEKGEVRDYANLNGVDVITMIAPTSKDRIKLLAEKATGFIYLVSSMGVTGVRSEIDTDLASIISDIRSSSNTPVAVGFGISSKEQAVEISKLADGVIVGSAIVKIIEEYSDHAGRYLLEYVSKMKNSL